MMNRFSLLSTLRIDSSRKIPFTFEGKQYYGREGDTIATAMFANGIRIFARSLKYHRPRGLYSLDGECSNTCMEVNGIPNVRCENTLLERGMIIKAQNVKGSLENDMMSFIDKMDWMMPAGFYYHTMHKPAKIWPIAMKQIRKANLPTNRTHMRWMLLTILPSIFPGEDAAWKPGVLSRRSYEEAAAWMVRTASIGKTPSYDEFVQ